MSYQREALGLMLPQTWWMTVRELRNELVAEIRGRRWTYTSEASEAGEQLWVETFLRPAEYLARPLDAAPVPSRDHLFATMLRVWG